MEIIRNKAFASCISLVLIAISIFGVGGNDIISEKNAAMDYFYTGEEHGISMNEIINNIMAQAHNSLVIARRYLGSDHELVQNIELNMRAVEEWPTHNLLSGHVASVLVWMRMLENQALEQGISQEGLGHISYTMATAVSNHLMIQSRQFHDRVDEFNELLNQFPANIIASVRGIEPLQPYIFYETP